MPLPAGDVPPPGSEVKAGVRPGGALPGLATPSARPADRRSPALPSPDRRPASAGLPSTMPAMRLTLVRHATLLVELGGRAAAGRADARRGGRARPGRGHAERRCRNPLVAAAAPGRGGRARPGRRRRHAPPRSDHFDETGGPARPARRARLLPARGRGAAARVSGSTPGRSRTSCDWDGLRIARTGGRHGTEDAVADALAPGQRVRPRRPLHRGRHGLVPRGRGRARAPSAPTSRSSTRAARASSRAARSS